MSAQVVSNDPSHGWGFFVIAIGMFLYGCFRIWKVMASLGWPVTKGKVVKSWVESYCPEGSNSGPTFFPNIEYTFVVGSTQYTSKKLYFMPKSTKDRLKAEAIIAPYRPGSEVEVHYNSKAPKDCVIERTSGLGWWMLSLGALFSVASGVKLFQ